VADVPAQAELWRVPLLTMLPWAGRDSLVFRRVIPVRDDPGKALATSNKDRATFGQQRNTDTGC